MTQRLACGRTMAPGIVILAAVALVLGCVGGVADADLLGYWKLDGDLADASGNNPAATFSAASTAPFAAGAFDQGINFGALTSSYVNTGMPLPAGQKSVVLFAKCDRLDSGDSLWVGNQIASDNTRFYIGTRGGRPFIGSGRSYNDLGAWASQDESVFHAFALVDTGANRIIAYQNGQEVAALNYTGSSATTPGGDFEIGRAGGGGPIPAYGSVVDDVAVFDTALSPGDLQFISNKGVAGYLAPMSTYVPGLVGYWSFNGDATDYAGHDGTLMNGASFSDGKFGQALTLDGLNDYVSVPDTPTLDPGFSSFSVAGWVKLQEETGTGDGDQSIIGKGTHGNLWGIRSKDDPNWALRGGMQNQTPQPTQSTYANAGAGIDLEDDAWHHVAMVVDRDDNTQSFYVDGQRVTQTNIASFTRVLESSLPLVIGTDLALGAYAKGQIDDVAMWLRPLEGYEIAFLADGNGGAGVELRTIIPEPTTMALLGLGALGLLRRRRKARRARAALSSPPLLLVLAVGLAVMWGGMAAEADVLGYWKLDGDTTDASGNRPAGTLSGSGGYVAGEFGQALDLISADGHVDTGLALASGQKTVVLYANTANWLPTSLWFGNGNNGSTQRFYYGTRTQKAAIGGGTAFVYTEPWDTTATGEFHHYALVEGPGQQLVAYQNGNEVATWTYPGGNTASPSGKHFEIGRGGGGGVYDEANALLDDVAVFDTSLTANAIGAIASSGVQAYLDSMSGFAVAYRETFPNDSGAHRNVITEGWVASYDQGWQSGSTTIPNVTGSRPLPAIASAPVHQSETLGYLYRDTAAAGRDYIYWTQEFSIPDVDSIKLIRWDQHNDSDSDILHVAVRLDTGTQGVTSDDTWFTSAEAFTNLTAQEYYTTSRDWYLNRLTMDGALWNQLSFVVNSSLGIVAGTPAPLSSGLAVTAFGLYSPAVNSTQRIDNFEIHVIPEPTTIAMLGLGVVGLLRRRRRRAR